MSSKKIKVNDPVNSPDHYTKGPVEMIKIIELMLTPEEYRGYLKGNMIKYIGREKYNKGDLDLRKAIKYGDFAVGGKTSKIDV